MAVRYEPPANVVSFSGEWEAELNQAVANRMSAVGVPDEMIGIQGMPYEDTGAFVRTHAIGGANNNIPGTGIIGSGPGINVDMAVLDQEFSGMSQVEAWAAAPDFGIALTQLSPTNTLRFYMGLTMQQYNLHLRHLNISEGARLILSSIGRYPTNSVNGLKFRRKQCLSSTFCSWGTLNTMGSSFALPDPQPTLS